MEVINSWVNNRTSGLIPKIIEELSEDTKIFLANALHFKDIWLTPFQNTDEVGQLLDREEFFVSSSENSSISVPMMLTRNKEINVTRLDVCKQNVEIIKVPYKSKNYTMKIIYPESLEDLENCTENIFLKTINTEPVLSEDVQLIMPKFNLSSKVELSDLFRQMELTSIFESKLEKFNFTRIYPIHLLLKF